MDFSSVERSLQSLSRRTPKFPQSVLELSDRLLSLRANDGLEDEDKDATYARSALDLIAYGTAGDDKAVLTSDGTKVRWEPLAVGLHLCVEYLEGKTKALTGGGSVGGGGTTVVAGGAGRGGGVGGGVYVEGPRVPTLVPEGGGGSAAVAAPAVADPRAAPAAAAAAPAVGAGGADSAAELLLPFCASLLGICESNLEHDEPRVRTLVAKAVGAHARFGAAVAASSSSASAASDALRTQRNGMYRTILTSLHRHLASGRDAEGKSKSSTGALDDTTGWRALETNLQGIASYVDGCGSLYVEEEASGEGEGEEEWEKLLDALESCCVDHVNRHVRAAGIAVLEQLVKSVVASVSSASSKEEARKRREMLTDDDSKLRTVIANVLTTTLADNWSQVRMASSVLCREFLVTLQGFAAATAGNADDEEEEEDDAISSLYPRLLPRMCLNRFYLAQGVKLYSHDTWKIVFGGGNGNEGGTNGGTNGGGGGMEAVAENAGPVCRYYVKMCDADNHVVREAACQAVAELAQKLGKNEDYAEYLAPFVPMLLQALLMCFHDESWPVRDEACLACGTFCLAYPEECAPELPTLFGRWTEHLTDQIWSVREDAAVALGDAIVAYGSDMLSKVLDVLKKNIPSARDQPSMTKEEFKKRQNDIDSHTNSQLYSCGSLAPKLRKGGAGRIGCSSCDVGRPKAPWEATDGCVYLLREVCVRCSSAEAKSSGAPFADDEVLLPLLTELADVCRVKHFPQSDDLRTTLWRQLPIVAGALGKQRFKRKYLHLFLDLLISNLDDRGDASQLSVHAAGRCAEELSALVGIGIFRGRLEEDWQKDAFDRAMDERRRTGGGGGAGGPPGGGGPGRGGPPGGPAADGGFSPFGPPGMFPSTTANGALGGGGVGGGGGAGGRTFSPYGAAVPGTRF